VLEITKAQKTFLRFALLAAYAAITLPVLSVASRDLAGRSSGAELCFETLTAFQLPNRLGTNMSDEDLEAEIERLRIENAALKKGATAGLMKVSEKGAVSVYGMGRFPVTLYKEQWLRLLDMSDDIRAFIAANETRLKTKEQK
jgi:hypothetical protein